MAAQLEPPLIPQEVPVLSGVLTVNTTQKMIVPAGGASPNKVYSLLPVRRAKAGSSCECAHRSETREASPPAPAKPSQPGNSSPTRRATHLEQSPIDIREVESHHVHLHPGEIEVFVEKAEADLIHKGTNFEWRWKEPRGNQVVVEGKVYNAVQFHFHTPSEHTIDGQHLAMELHFVHQAADGALAVVAVIFREGARNAFLDQFWSELPKMDPTDRNTVALGEIDPTLVKEVHGTFFHYRGSLTTPPYTEGVQWIVMHEDAEATPEQIHAFTEALHGFNARPVQPLNQRAIDYAFVY